ncbi:6803_t:CDS:2 [Funneliformis mosseae]|uniref:6803_t:CDS:1 n=1 Tax=Funneliformis mosseae TaxID=27381 RepID=A0A9N8ZMY8_FUNMO|nr:6803_t:CDS:2 [Funneliformis mosseae]
MNQKTKLESVAPYIQKLYKGKNPAFSKLEKELSLWSLCIIPRSFTSDL